MQNDIDTLQRKLDAAKENLALLITQWRALTAQVEDIEQKIRKLDGSLPEEYTWVKYVGEIQRLETDLAKAKLKYEDDKLPKVVWTTKQDYYSGMVVDKITKKRIYVKHPGHTNYDLYNLDGTAVANSYRRSIIDLRQTFKDYPNFPRS